MPTSQPQHRPLDAIAVHLDIRGRVQGVGYRFAVQAQAQALQLQGWVRNQVDGSVQAQIQGPRAAVQALQAWCQRGPASARVTSVRAEPMALDSQLGASFACRETAD